MRKSISEDDLKTFDGWLTYQGFDATAMPENELVSWGRIFEETRERSAAIAKVGLMKFKPLVLGEYRYAVALREGNDLWLTLWVRRSPKGEFFVMLPRGDHGWDPHTSYHRDGTLHMKSFNRKVLTPQKRQPLTGKFQGSEHLGMFYGHGPKSVGAICDPKDFSGIVEIEAGVLGPGHGGVTVDLVEPDHEPIGYDFTDVATRKVFCETDPCVVITVGSSDL
jgi:hypothetical protein